MCIGIWIDGGRIQYTLPLVKGYFTIMYWIGTDNEYNMESNRYPPGLDSIT